MDIRVVTSLPELIHDAFRWGVVGRALQRGQWSLKTYNPRDFAKPPHFSIDDRPFGGGPGMVLLHEPMAAAIDAAHSSLASIAETRPSHPTRAKRILLSPAGRRFDQAYARQLRDAGGFVLVCGRYEGLDQRTIDSHIDEQLSLGDFVLSGGEFAALAVIDAVTRLLPGVLGDPYSSVEESFNFGLLDHPHYTRPEVLADGRAVPRELLSGNHEEIRQFRRKQSLAYTLRHRPDLLATSSHLTPSDLAYLRSLGYNR